MKPFHCFVKFEGITDAYLYGGSVFVVTNEGDIRALPLSKIYSLLHDKKSQTFQSLLEMILLRNDWLDNPQAKNTFRIVQARGGLEKAWLKQFETTIECRAQGLPWERIGSTGSGNVYDIICYGYHMFLGSAEGLYVQRLDFTDYQQAKAIGTTYKSFDAKTVHLSAKSGEVALSCGTNGLFNGSLKIKEKFRVGPKSHSEISFRTNWSGHNIINYKSSTNFDYLYNKVQKVSKRRFGYSELDDDHAKVRIAKFAERTEPMAKFLPEVLSQIPNVSFVYNSNQNLFLFIRGGKIIRSNIVRGSLTGFHASRTYDEMTPRAKKPVRPALGNVLSIASLPHGSVVEFKDSVVALLPSSATVLCNSPVFSVRTYPRSRRYRRLTTVVDKDGLHLFGFFPSEREWSLSGKQTFYLAARNRGANSA